MIDFREQNGSTTFAVRVAARASRTELAGEHDGALRVRVAAPPVEGAANDELVRFFAKLLGVSRGDVEIVSGLTSKNKVVRVRGVARGVLESLARSLESAARPAGTRRAVCAGCGPCVLRVVVCGAEKARDIFAPLPKRSITPEGQIGKCLDIPSGILSSTRRARSTPSAARSSRN